MDHRVALPANRDTIRQPEPAAGARRLAAAFLPEICRFFAVSCRFSAASAGALRPAKMPTMAQHAPSSASLIAEMPVSTPGEERPRGARRLITVRGIDALESWRTARASLAAADAVVLLAALLGRLKDR